MLGSPGRHMRILLAAVLLLAGGCGWLRPAPTPILPPDELYSIGESDLAQKRYDQARESFKKIVERHPNSSYAARARFLTGEAYYREAEFDKAIEQFRKLVKEYPESRYATEALAKIDICRGRLAQKEVWVANYYFTQGNRSSARQRLELVLKEYPRTLVIPEALFMLAEVNFHEGKNAEAVQLLRRLSEEYGYTEFGRRAVQRLRAQR